MKNFFMAEKKLEIECSAEHIKLCLAAAVVLEGFWKT